MPKRPTRRPATVPTLRAYRVTLALILVLSLGGVSFAIFRGSRATADRVIRTQGVPDPSMPPEKAGLVAGAQDLEGDLADTPPIDEVAAFADSGDPSQISAVKLAVPQLMTNDRATFRLPLDEADIAMRLGSPLDATWSSTAEAVQYQEKYDALKSIIQDPLFRPYSDNQFVVTTWQGVSVTGQTAWAVLLGHDSYLDDQGWSVDPDEQWQIHLMYESNVWKLSEVDAYQTGGAN